jgi:hypothetical protein
MQETRSLRGWQKILTRLRQGMWSTARYSSDLLPRDERASSSRTMAGTVARGGTDHHRCRIRRHHLRLHRRQKLQHDGRDHCRHRLSKSPPPPSPPVGGAGPGRMRMRSWSGAGWFGPGQVAHSARTRPAYVESNVAPDSGSAVIKMLSDPVLRNLLQPAPNLVVLCNKYQNRYWPATFARNVVVLCNLLVIMR